MVAIFLNTLQPPFYEHMIGNWNISSNFANIIIIGERIETEIKMVKLHMAHPRLQIPKNQVSIKVRKKK